MTVKNILLTSLLTFILTFIVTAIYIFYPLVLDFNNQGNAGIGATGHSVLVLLAFIFIVASIAFISIFTVIQRKVKKLN